MPTWSDLAFDDKANPDLTRAIWRYWSDIGEKFKLTHMNSHNKSGWKSRKIGTREKFMYEMNDKVDKLATIARVNIANGKYKMHY